MEGQERYDNITWLTLARDYRKLDPRATGQTALLVWHV